MKFYKKLKFFEFGANFAEILVGTPLYPFFKKFFNGSKVLCLGSFVHKYHQNRPNRKKVTPFLIIINDIGEAVTGGEKDLQLFIDDVGFLEYGDKSTK